MTRQMIFFDNQYCCVRRNSGRYFPGCGRNEIERHSCGDKGGARGVLEKPSQARGIAAKRINSYLPLPAQYSRAVPDVPVAVP